MARTRAEPREGARRDPARCARSSEKDVRVLGDERDAQPVAREGGPGRRLPRARRAAVPRRAAPRGVLRRPLPRSSTRPRTARRCATTSTSRTSPRGSATGDGPSPMLHKEPLEFEYVAPRAARATSSGGRCRAMNITLKVWRQAGPDAAGALRDLRRARTSAPTCRSSRCSTSSTSGSMPSGEEPIAFDHDCREGICGIVRADDQRPGRTAPSAAPRRASCTCASSPTATRSPSSRGAPPRSRSCKDLVVDRSAFDRIIEAGGFITVDTGAAPTPTSIPIPKPVADAAMDAAACIGCGACVAACPNGAGAAVHVGQDRAPQPAAAGSGRALDRASRPWSRPWRSTSAPAPTTASARRRARRRSRSTSSR